MASKDPCEYLEWDSQFFKCRVARIRESSLTHAGMQAAIDWCVSEQIDCLYFLADSQSQESVGAAEEARFCLVDLRVSLERDLRGAAATPGIGSVRACEPGDLPRLEGIAATSHRDSRFYADRNFPRELCDELYRTWIRKSCTGFADAVLVAGVLGEPVGYISCQLEKNERGRIGLFAVKREAQGEGLGRALIGAALSWFSERGAAYATVVTQGRNARAQRAYQDSGFRTMATQLWYHKWFTKQ